MRPIHSAKLSFTDGSLHLPNAVRQTVHSDVLPFHSDHDKRLVGVCCSVCRPFRQQDSMRGAHWIQNR